MKYLCNNPGCSPSIIIFQTILKKCQLFCLNYLRCRLVTFDPSSNQCEIFDEISVEHGDIITQIGVTTMTVIHSRQLMNTMSTDTTRTFTTNTITTSSQTTTTGVTTPTTTANPCASGSLHWNTTGITILGIPSAVATSGLFVDINDTLYAADEVSNYVVWKLLENSVNATIVAGIAGSLGQNSTQLNSPNDVYVDRNGNMYVVDTYNHRIQKFINGSTNGMTIAGITASTGSSLNQLFYPRYVTFDSTDTYISVADYNNNRVLRFSTNSTEGTIGVVMAGGTGASNSNTSLNYPWGIHSLSSVSNDLFIVNFGGHSVMRWTPGASSGVFVAGTPGVSGSNSSLLSGPMGIRIDSYLNMYVIDSGNHRVQMFCANSQMGVTIAGTGSASNSATQLNGPRGITFDSAMNLYIADFNNRRIQKFVKF